MQSVTRTELTPRGAATRARIVDAAATLVREKGLANTGLDAVLEASRASKSQLYHYFADRDDLVLAVVHRRIEGVLAANEPFLRDFDSVERLREWRDELVAQARTVDCAGGCLLGSLVGELGESPAARAAIAGGFNCWREHFVRGFSRMQAAGRLPASADPIQLATAMLAALQGGLLLAQVERSSRPLEVALDMALAHVDDSARAPDPPLVKNTHPAAGSR